MIQKIKIELRETQRQLESLQSEIQYQHQIDEYIIERFHGLLDRLCVISDRFASFRIPPEDLRPIRWITYCEANLFKEKLNGTLALIRTLLKAPRG